MSTSLDQEAEAIVAEMMAIGATFQLCRSGGELRWHYEARPSMRGALRRYRQDLDLTRPGMQAAMLRAIARVKFVGGLRE